MPVIHKNDVRKKKAWFAMAVAALALGVCLSVSVASPDQALAPEAAGRLVLSLDPAHSNVHFTVDTTLHTVHGEFIFKRGSIELNSETGQAAGEIVVDASSGKSGNDSRDKRMHKEILESDHFTDVKFRPDRIDGKVALSEPSMVQVHGIFTLHGADHEITIPVQVDISGDDWKSTASFGVPYIQWGLKNPSNFLLKVSPTVNISLEMAGSLKIDDKR